MESRALPMEPSLADSSTGERRVRWALIFGIVLVILVLVGGLRWLGYLGNPPIEASPPEGAGYGVTQIGPGERVVFGIAVRNASGGAVSDLHVRLPSTVDGGSRLVDVYVVNPGNPLNPGVVGWPEFNQVAVPAGAHRLTAEESFDPGDDVLLGVVIEVGRNAANASRSLYQEEFAGVIVEYRFRGTPHEVRAGPSISLCNGTFETCGDEWP